MRVLLIRLEVLRAEHKSANNERRQGLSVDLSARVEVELRRRLRRRSAGPNEQPARWSAVSAVSGNSWL